MKSTADNFSLQDQMKFISIIQDYPVVLDKSMVLETRIKKAKALEEVKGRILIDIGLEMRESQIMKKIQNMKNRLKKKTDLFKTGNKKVILKDWEKELLKLLEGELNPSTVELKGAVSAEFKSSGSKEVGNITEGLNEEKNEVEEETHESFSSISTGSLLGSPPVSPRSYETDETKDLSTPQLQRVVLLEQLKYFRKAQEVLEIKKKKLQRNNGIFKENKAKLFLEGQVMYGVYDDDKSD